MAILLKDLIADPKKLETLKLQGQKCAYCQVDLQEAITGKRKAPKGCACSDCYYMLLGEAVEQSPIVSPRVRRG